MRQPLHTKLFKCINSFPPHKTLRSWYYFPNWGNDSTERLSNFPKVAQLLITSSLSPG